MNALVVKRFRFEAGHHLPNHDGECRHPHGHSYVVEVGITGPIDETPGSPTEGMVIDFGRIKNAFNERIHAVCDHRTLNDVVPVSVTTAEMLAVWILAEMRDEFPTDFTRPPHERQHVAFVRVYETIDNYAEVG